MVVVRHFLRIDFINFNHHCVKLCRAIFNLITNKYPCLWYSTIGASCIISTRVDDGVAIVVGVKDAITTSQTEEERYVKQSINKLINLRLAYSTLMIIATVIEAIELIVIHFHSTIIIE